MSLSSRRSRIVIDHHPGRHRMWPAALTSLIWMGAAPADRQPLAFEVTYDAGVRPGPISARVYVMLGPAQGGKGEPRKGPDWFPPRPFCAVEAKEGKAGEPLRVGPDAVGFPGPLGSLAPGDYAAQAVIR